MIGAQLVGGIFLGGKVFAASTGKESRVVDCDDRGKCNVKEGGVLMGKKKGQRYDFFPQSSRASEE